MPEARTIEGGAVRELIFVPAIVTLAVTLLRLLGELMNWSPVLFSRAAGGGGALVGISWLIPVFGAYFAVKLSRSGYGPASIARAFLLALVAGALAIGSGLAAGRLWGELPGFLVVSLVGVALIALAYRGWPALGKTLLAYAFAARVPVAIVMLLAILGDWGTHYDVTPPSFPAISAFRRWLWIGLFPQMTFWIFLTVVGGMVAGSIAAAFVGRRAAA
jgi:hypothetical protein